MTRETVAFAKMHGLGNDFVVVDARDPLPASATTDPGALARQICNRHYGVGADGLIWMLPSSRADVRMRIFNSDGSEAEMCGNGIRCLAAFAHARGAVTGRVMSVETGAGILSPTLLDDGRVEVDMGEPVLPCAQIPAVIPGVGETERVIDARLVVDDEAYTVCGVSIGNPHCILFLDVQGTTRLAGCDLSAVPLERVGPRIERCAAFPAGTNVEFAVVSGRDEIDLRVWERGSGITLACGTGACATMVAAALSGRVGHRARVNLPGGTLEIEWRPGSSVKMRGPQVWVYDGVWPAA